MEELGLHSSKSQPVFERNAAPEIEASKSLVLGDMLSFVQQYLNKIIEKVFPGYEIEFVGYERDDPKQILDLTKGELESYKTVNEVRKEKGLPPLESKWADECPANPQLVQMYQAEQMDDSGGMEDPEGGADGGEWEDVGIGGENKDGNSNPDFGSGEEDNAEPKDGNSVNKSLIYVF